jgi:hypothetical protein
MKFIALTTIILVFSFSNYLVGQTLEEREKQIVLSNNIKSKVQYDYKYKNGTPSEDGQMASIATYSKKGELLEKKYYNSKGLVNGWEKYEYDDDGNRTLYERESNNSKYKKESIYNDNRQAILEAGYSGEEKFKTTYTYNNSGKPLEIVRYINNYIEEKLVYNHSGNTAIVSIYSKGKNLRSKLKLVYNDKGNIIQETLLSVDNKELEKKTFNYNEASQVVLEEKTRAGKFYYRISNIYDSKGNLTKVYEETLAKKKYLKKEYVFTINDNLLEYKWRRNPDEEFNVKNYTYDARGICASEKTYYSNTQFRSLSKYRYVFY